MKTDLGDVGAWIRERKSLLDCAFEAEGKEWCRMHTEFVDRVFRHIIEAASAGDLVSLTATGGYGRYELAPYSDLDITLIPIDESEPAIEVAVKQVFALAQTTLSEALGYKIGYSLTIVHDAPGLDAKSRTGFLDARHVAGNLEAHRRFMDKFKSSFPVGDFLVAKVAERMRQLAETNDTPLVLEPNLKEGAGGLRDYHFATWIAKAIGQPIPDAPAEYGRLLGVRNQLHSIAGKAMDRLTASKRIAIAERLLQDPNQFGGEFAKALIKVDTCREFGLKLLRTSTFEVTEGVRAVNGTLEVGGHTTLCDAAYAVSLAVPIGLGVGSFDDVSNLGSGPSFMAALKNEQTIRALDRAQLLGRILPELEACRTLFPEDSVHQFTVFEHTLRVCRALEDRSTPFLADVWSNIGDAGPVFLAALLHDVGKCDQSGPHSEIGARIAASICARLGLSERESDLIVWLVAEHLRMDRTVRFRDVQHPDTIREFAQVVENSHRLACLTLLTLADVKSVSEETWTPAYEALLRELFARTLHYLDHAAPGTGADPAHLRRKLLRELKEVAKPEDLEAFLNLMPASYVISTPAELARLHLDYYQKALRGEPSIEFDHAPELGTTEMTVCTRDRFGLLNQILGVIYALDLSISGLRAATSRGENPIALDTFTISFGDKSVPPATNQRLAATLKSILAGEMQVDEVLKQHGKDPSRKQEHRSFSYLEGNPSILEVRAPRGRGMAYRLTRILSEAGLAVVSARVGQWAGNGVAAFYLVDPTGTPITHTRITKLMA